MMEQHSRPRCASIASTERERRHRSTADQRLRGPHETPKEVAEPARPVRRRLRLERRRCAHIVVLVDSSSLTNVECVHPSQTPCSLATANHTRARQGKSTRGLTAHLLTQCVRRFHILIFLLNLRAISSHHRIAFGDLLVHLRYRGLIARLRKSHHTRG